MIARQLELTMGDSPAGCLSPRLAELAERYADVLLRIADVSERQDGTSAEVIAARMAALFPAHQEQLRVVLLTTKNAVIDTPLVVQGDGNTAAVRMADIFRPAIAAGAVAIILSHNHPSGDPTPSPNDVNLTREAVGAGALLGIEVIDHVIVGTAAHWHSLRASMPNTFKVKQR
jgi:DNA repair protein RadC